MSFLSVALITCSVITIEHCSVDGIIQEDIAQHVTSSPASASNTDEFTTGYTSITTDSSSTTTESSLITTRTGYSSIPTYSASAVTDSVSTAISSGSKTTAADVADTNSTDYVSTAISSGSKTTAADVVDTNSTDYVSTAISSGSKTTTDDVADTNSTDSVSTAISSESKTTAADVADTNSTEVVSASTVTGSSSAANNQTTVSIYVERTSSNPKTKTFEATTLLSTCDNCVDNHDNRIDLDLHEYFSKTVTSVTVVVGLIGNAATLFALQGQAFNKIPSRYILSALAVSDCLALITNALNTKIVIDFIGHDIRAYDRNSCKIFNFFARFAKMLSSWLVVLVCCERFVAICLPLRAKLICTKSNALMGIAISVIGLATYDGIWTLSTEKVGFKCNPSFWTPKTEVRGKVIMYIGSLLIGLLPMAIMLILTPVMCITLHRNRLSRKRLSSTYNPEVTKVSAMLISVCIAYIVLLLPLITAHNIAFAQGENLIATKDLPLMILSIVGENLAAINYSCNFFLYVVFNTSFRRRVFLALICFRRNGTERITRSNGSVLTLSAVTH